MRTRTNTRQTCLSSPHPVVHDKATLSNFSSSASSLVYCFKSNPDSMHADEPIDVVDVVCLLHLNSYGGEMVQWLEREFTDRKVHGSNPTAYRLLMMSQMRWDLFRVRWPKWLEREFTDRKVRGSNPNSASRLPLSRLGQPGSIPAFVLPSGGMAARHRKGATAERFSFLFCTCTEKSKVFELICKLGKGSYGSVFKARYKATGGIVAIKKVPVDSDLTDIVKEISIMQQCDSPFIVKCYGSLFDSQDLWICMEYCGAGSIADIMRLRGKALEEREIATVLQYSLRGLDYLHQSFNNNNSNNCSAVTPFRCLDAIPPGKSTGAGILPGRPGLDRGSRVADVLYALHIYHREKMQRAECLFCIPIRPTLILLRFRFSWGLLRFASALCISC
ncbi:hypothetical protein T265_11967 [Opisthorchis viverrini]|uniref:non-specific serine/threonine protein kinase n=1 Tax=Opisthorchis viverrini TaxID=6198 RepID=A0A074Z135_OPIVI|nr:hypothetical protein T265_11967 [Opisthorchis viverrini]KER19167.1 hypothetical protein T265_11967 [Opisthorchis viverrini]